MPDFESDADEALAEAAEFKTLLGSLKDSKLTIDVDFSQVTAAIAEVEALKAALTDSDQIKLDVDTTGVAAAEAKLAKIKQECKFEHRLILDGKELRIIGDKHVEKFRKDDA